MNNLQCESVKNSLLAIFVANISSLFSFLQQNLLVCLSPSLPLRWLFPSPPLVKEDLGTGRLEVGSGGGEVCPQEATLMRKRRTSRKTKAPAGWLLSQKRTLTNVLACGVCWSHPRNRRTEKRTEEEMCPFLMMSPFIFLIRYFHNIPPLIFL